MWSAVQKVVDELNEKGGLGRGVTLSNEKGGLERGLPLCDIIRLAQTLRFDVFK